MIRSVRYKICKMQGRKNSYRDLEMMYVNDHTSVHVDVILAEWASIWNYERIQNGARIFLPKLSKTLCCFSYAIIVSWTLEYWQRFKCKVNTWNVGPDDV